MGLLESAGSWAPQVTELWSKATAKFPISISHANICKSKLFIIIIYYIIRMFPMRLKTSFAWESLQNRTSSSVKYWLSLRNLQGAKITEDPGENVASWGIHQSTKHVQSHDPVNTDTAFTNSYTCCPVLETIKTWALFCFLSSFFLFCKSGILSVITLVPAGGFELVK